MKGRRFERIARAQKQQQLGPLRSSQVLTSSSRMLGDNMDNPSAESGTSGVSKTGHEAPHRGITMAASAAMLFIVVSTVVVIGILMVIPGEDRETVTTSRASDGISQRPKGFGRSLLCIVSHLAEADTLFPPDGLCDVLSMYVSMESNAIVPHRAAENPLPNFYAAAQRSARTGYGIHFAQYTEGLVAAKLQRDEGAKAMEELWNKKVRHYSLLNCYHPGPDDVIALFNKFRELQRRFKGEAADIAAFVFLGVYPESNIDSNRKDIQKIMTASPPDAVVFHTATIYTLPGYTWPEPLTVEVPNAWKEYPRARKQTLERGINFRKDVRLQGFPAFLTLGVGVLVNLPFENGKFDENDGVGTIRNKAYTTHRGWACNLLPTNVVHDDAKYMVKTVVRKEENALGVFDYEESLRKKMCLAIVEGGYDGPWAVEDTEFADGNNTCGEGNFAALKWIKAAMNTNFTSC